MIRLRLKASQNLILLVENTDTGENLPVGEKSKVRALNDKSYCSESLGELIGPPLEGGVANQT